MAKRVSKKTAKKRPRSQSATKKQTFPPQLNGPDGKPLHESPVSITGFSVPIYDHNPFVYEGEDHA